MKIAGIIAEYNPFHNGHAWQIDELKKRYGADFVIVVMSGDFVQRGGPALLPKQVRARMALAGGADLILELPVAMASASAEYFAGGGVEIMDRLGCIDVLCFGTEADEELLPQMKKAAGLLLDEPPVFSRTLQEELKKGRSFPRARQTALTAALSQNGGNAKEGDTSWLSSPNNILALEYIKALSRRGSRICPLPIRRKGAGDNDMTLSEDGFSSASAIRSLIEAGADQDSLNHQLPSESLLLLKESLHSKAWLCDADLDLLLHASLLGKSEDELAACFDLSRDLARRIRRELPFYEGFSQFAHRVKTSQITLTRVRRALTHILLGLSEEEGRHSPLYVRVLGLRRENAFLLQEIKKRGSIQPVMKPARIPDFEHLDSTTAASNLYQSVLFHKQRNSGWPACFRHDFQIPAAFR